MSELQDFAGEKRKVIVSSLNGSEGMYKNMHKKINNITTEIFAKYGYVIEHNADNEKEFQIILRENENVGWRIAVLKFKRESFKKVEKHPDSMESFEPVDGVTLICLALPENPEVYEVFLLDKPVCLYKNIWHAVVSLSEHAIVKITENLNVNSDFYEFSVDHGIFIG